MKIKKVVLLDFLNKVGLNNTMTHIAAIDMTPEGIIAGNKDDAVVTMYNGKIKINSISDYSPIGKIGIVDVKFMASIVSRLHEDIQMDIGKEGVLFKSDTRKILTALGDTDNLEVKNLPTAYKPDIKLKVSTSKLKEVLDDTAIFSDGSSNSAWIEFRMEKNAMKFIVGDSQRKEKMEDTLMCEYSGNEISSKYSNVAMRNIIKVLTAKEVNVSFSNDAPLLIEEDTGSIIGTYVIAPWVLPTEGEENKPEETAEPIATKIEVVQ